MCQQLLEITILLTGKNFNFLTKNIRIKIFFLRQFDCMKFGSDGVALVSPEDGGGHPGYPPVINAGTDAEIDAGGTDDIDDYDEVVG